MHFNVDQIQSTYSPLQSSAPSTHATSRGRHAHTGTTAITWLMVQDTERKLRKLKLNMRLQ